MAEFLLELFSEEIPAGMQPRGVQELERLMAEGLVAAGLEIKDKAAFATPRRLVLGLTGLSERSADVSEERRGPRVGAPEKAIEGFLRSAGLSDISQAEVATDPKKGEFYIARIERPGRAAGEIIAELIPQIVRQFPWPKSMRWGSGSLRWVRPLHGILCLLDGKVVPFEVDGLKSGDESFGHRFLAPEAFKVTGLQDYMAKLKSAHVVLDPHARRQIIIEHARQAAGAIDLELVEDDALLNENAGLAEWPVVLAGSFDEAFLDVPPEVLITSMKAHQKCFSLRNAKSGKLANRFIMVSNLIADDGGKAIVAGNERVIRARLSDAKFFWDQDRKTRLEDRLPALEGVIFHEKLGSQAERAERLQDLARDLAPTVGANPDHAARAALLAKADLVSHMVGEFPALQGLMGRYYASQQGEDDSVATAIELHYKPQGPNDAVPDKPVAIAVALADKLDILEGFWAANEKPTGSKDPFALRRAALGVIRILLENDIKLPLGVALASHLGRFQKHLGADFGKDFDHPGFNAFFADRLKVYLRDRGARHDLIDAVFALPGSDDLLIIVKRVEALGAFLETDDGANLLSGAKRAQNILRIEEKKDDQAYDGEPDAKLLKDKEEAALGDAISKVRSSVAAALEGEDFAGAMAEMAKLRQPVDDFFDRVTVNADDAALRQNRLRLLGQIRATTLHVADFSKIEG